MDTKDNIVFSKNVIEFVTVAREFCLLAENIKIVAGKDLAFQSQKILSLLYLKASLLPDLKPIGNEDHEDFVNEFELNYLSNKVAEKLGNYDVNLRLPGDLNNFEFQSEAGSFSEVFASVYKEIFNFISQYRSGDMEKMNDAVWECKQSFELGWGNKVIAMLGALHLIVYRPTPQI